MHSGCRRPNGKRPFQTSLSHVTELLFGLVCGSNVKSRIFVCKGSGKSSIDDLFVICALYSASSMAFVHVANFLWIEARIILNLEKVLELC